MRYFLITFSLKYQLSIGSATLFSDKFPSQKYINSYIISLLEDKQEITIISVFEFKSKKDYDDYND